MTVYAASKRARFRNTYRSGAFGPMHLRYGRGAVLAEAKRTATMAQVTGLVATEGSLKADLVWVGQPDVNHYLVEKSADGIAGWSTVATVNAGLTSLTVTGLTADVAVYFRVSAVNGAGTAGTVSDNATCTPTE